MRGQQCFGNRAAEFFCCVDPALRAELMPFFMPGGVFDLSDGDEAACFLNGRTAAECCEAPVDVLLVTYPKVASTALLDVLRAAGKRVKRTHALEDAFLESARMQPPCTVITVARNFYTRSPSHFFHNLVVDPAKHTVAVQQYNRPPQP